MIPFRRLCFGVLFILTIASPAAIAQQTKTCSATDADKPAVAETLRAMYAAAIKDDVAAFDALVTPGFYMYDGGKRFDGDAIMKLTLDLHKQGYKTLWSVQNPVVEVDCNSAWIAYVNEGAFTNPAGVKEDIKWLESAVLVKRDGHWLIRFFHSTRMS